MFSASTTFSSVSNLETCSLFGDHVKMLIDESCVGSQPRVHDGGGSAGPVAIRETYPEGSSERAASLGPTTCWRRAAAGWRRYSREKKRTTQTNSEGSSGRGGNYHYSIVPPPVGLQGPGLDSWYGIWIQMLVWSKNICFANSFVYVFKLK